MTSAKKRGSTRKWRAISKGGAVAAGMAVGLTAALATPGAADDRTTLESATSKDGWGTILPGEKCAQAHSWVASAALLGMESRFLEAHSPPTGNAAEETADLKLDLGFAGIAGPGANAWTDAKPVKPGGRATEFARCHAYAEAHLGEAWIDILGVKFEINAIKPWAIGTPGKPVKFGGGVLGGRIEIFGNEVLNVNELWPSDLGIRFAKTPGSEEILTAITKEQVTTDQNGEPTKDGSGDYFKDGNAQSGYTNAIRLAVFGKKGGELNLGHAAVLINRDYMPADLCDENARCIKPAKGRN